MSNIVTWYAIRCVLLERWKNCKVVIVVFVNYHLLNRVIHIANIKSNVSWILSAYHIRTPSYLDIKVFPINNFS